jgi:hypothetical protein
MPFLYRYRHVCIRAQRQQPNGYGTPVAIAFPIVQASACQGAFCQPQGNAPWQVSQAGGDGTVTSSPDSAEQHELPIVSSMDDHARLIDDIGFDIPLSEASIEIMQDLEFCADAAMDPDTMVDEVGSVVSKYEVPMGPMNKV